MPEKIIRLQFGVLWRKVAAGIRESEMLIEMGDAVLMPDIG